VKTRAQVLDITDRALFEDVP